MNTIYMVIGQLVVAGIGATMFIGVLFLIVSLFKKQNRVKIQNYLKDL